MRCDNCIYNKYKRFRERPVNQASLAIVSDVPSVMDVLNGTLLDSRGGSVVFGTMEKVGLDKDDVFLTSALACAVPKKKGKPIAKTPMQNCRDHVIAQLEESGARTVIVLGSTAAKVVMGDFGLKLKENQGLAKSVPELPGVNIIITNHPALLLRTPGEYKQFLRHFQYAAALHTGTEIRDPGTTKWATCDTLEDVQKALVEIEKREFVGVDIETTDLQPWISEKQGRVGKSLVIGVALEKNKVLGFTKNAMQYMQPIFDLPNTRFVWHGGKFDKLFERVADGLDVRIDEDLMLLDYALNETSGTHNLEQISMRLLGAEPYKDEANKFIKSGTFGEAPIETQLKRVCIDADYTLQAFLILREQVLSSPDLTRLYYDRLLPGVAAYTYVEEAGMGIDTKAIGVLKSKYEAQIAEKLEAIEESTELLWDSERYKQQTGAKTAGVNFKPTSPKQVSWLIFDRLKLKPKKRDGRSTSADILESIAKPRPHVVDLILELRSINKEYGTYVKGMLSRMDEEGRVHSSFSLHITATGRRSSKQPNIQNIPSRRLDIRRTFVPRPGYTIMEVDYSAAESRVLAIISDDPDYLQVFYDGRDPHGDLAVALYGEDFTKTQRGRAKAVNFGVPYGRQSHSIAEEHGMSHTEAQDLIDAWAAKYPKAWKFLEACSDLALEGKAVRSPMGRYKRPGLITPQTVDGIRNEYKNYPIQSTVAEFTLLSVVELQKELDPEEAYIVNEVHDSLVLEVKDDPEILLRVGNRVAEVMSEVPKRELGWTLPFHCDIEVGYNWADILDLEDFIKVREQIPQIGFKEAKASLHG